MAAVDGLRYDDDGVYLDGTHVGVVSQVIPLSPSPWGERRSACWIKPLSPMPSLVVDDRGRPLSLIYAALDGDPAFVVGTKLHFKIYQDDEGFEARALSRS